MLEQLQRGEVSNPPAYGAKIAQLILSDEELFKTWQNDLVTMSSRIRSMRQALYDNLISHGTLSLVNKRMQPSIECPD